MRDYGIAFALDKVSCNRNSICGFVRGQFVHELHHELLHDRTKSAGARIACQGFFCDRLLGFFFESKLYMIQAKELHILLDNGVFGITQNANQRITI